MPGQAIARTVPKCILRYLHGASNMKKRGMFRSKNGRKWWTYYHPLLEGYYAEEILLQKWMEMTHFSYIVTKMSNNHPYLESFSLPLLDDSVIMKQSSIFGLF